MSTKIFVAGLPSDVRESELQDIFSKYGGIRSISIKSQGRSPYAFVDFEESKMAEEAVKGEVHRDFNGQTLRVEIATGKAGSRREGRDSKYGPPKRTDYRVEVTHLPYHCSWQDLKDHMRKEGDVGYCTIHGDVGYVEYIHYDDMKHALKYLDDTKLVCGRESSYIRVRRSRDRSRSRSSYGRDRSRSPSHGRDRSRSREDRDRNYDDKSRSTSRKSTEKRETSQTRSKSPEAESKPQASRSGSRHSPSRSSRSRSASRRSVSGSRSGSRSAHSDRD